MPGNLAAVAATLRSGTVCQPPLLRGRFPLAWPGLQVSVSGVSFRDLSPEIYSLLPVKASIPHLAKACSLESVQVSFDGTDQGGGGTTTEVQLQDLVLHGYAGETGNFVARYYSLCVWWWWYWW